MDYPGVLLFTFPSLV